MAMPARRVRRRVTLTDIADACGVAPSTVSRALSNPNRVSPQMYERVVRKARELGYASAMIPASRTRTTRGTIALVVPNLTNPFNLDLIRGCQARAQAGGFLLLLVTSDDSEEVEGELLSELSDAVDGIVVASPRAPDAVLERVADRVPLVALNREAGALSGVVIDTPVGLVSALDYLVSLGHTHIAYVRGPGSSWLDRVRFGALKEAADRAAVCLLPVGAFRPTLAAGAAAADAVALADVTAAIFFNDALAIGALMRFAARGVAVPDDLSVIGCDDIFGASFTSPPLTTVSASGEQAGRATMDLLLGRFTTKDRSRRMDHLPSQLTVRESTGRVPPSR
ncbi:DNA-binding LacI/PurR family transcriptional regulator [Pseudoclavibacter chungangensis]|uniref:LacI family DNA-binding transcriptional regulator n=1 Tax=Pseudoclavibacter chungangensis TaxID=587635 RepID=UPI001822CFF5|nr:LacI family DNA-binding transcriptional regulator [Pseudoclavibacter chungangensis]NYJ67098.1 DNA-binding LacI/PurR family transcriptional regulator [Pseudoclavibacter chungangensis]